MNTVRRLDVSDAESMARIHMNTFEGFFLTSLGFYFLKTYYIAFLEDTFAIGVGVLDNSANLKGFAVGSCHPWGLNTRLFLNNPFKFLRVLFMPILKRPTIVINLLTNFKKPNKFSGKADVGELFSICIEKDKRGTGVSDLLLEEFNKECVKRGVIIVTLTTDATGNERALRFYRKNGFELSQQFVVAQGRQMYRLSRRFSNND